MSDVRLRSVTAELGRARDVTSLHLTSFSIVWSKSFSRIDMRMTSHWMTEDRNIRTNCQLFLVRYRRPSLDQ